MANSKMASLLGMLLCAASLATVFFLGFIQPRTLPAAQRAIQDEHTRWLLIAAIVALITVPLAWRWAYRVLGRHDHLPPRIRVPASRVVLLCLVSIVAVAAIAWLRARMPAPPVVFGMLQLTFFVCFLATVSTALRWLRHRAHPATPSAPKP